MNKKLQDLLPTGLTQETIKSIGKIVEDTVKSRIDEETKQLGAKVFAFLKLRQDEIKDEALKQLEEENEIFRNAKLFEHVRSLMALEVMSEDYDLPLSQLVDENKELNSTVETLTEELSKVLTDNSKLENSVKLLETKVANLGKSLTESVEAKKLPFKSSEKALIITEGHKTDSEKTLESIKGSNNPFLSEETVKLALGNKGVKLNDIR